jgi:hypothetical protein
MSVVSFTRELKLRETNTILRLIKRGHTVPEIAETLKLPERNVRAHWERIRKRWLKEGDELRDAIKAKLDAQYDAVLVAGWQAWERSLEEESETVQALHSQAGADRKIASVRKRRARAQPAILNVIVRALEAKAELHGLRQPAQVFVSATARANGMNAIASARVLVIQGGHEIDIDSLRTIPAEGEPIDVTPQGLPPVLDAATVPLPE